MAHNSESSESAGADGDYGDGSGHGQVFVASEVHGTWGTAEEVPGTAGLNMTGFASMGSLSCAPVGTCSADVFYQPSSAPVLQAFVVKMAYQQPGPRQQPATPQADGAAAPGTPGPSARAGSPPPTGSPAPQPGTAPPAGLSRQFPARQAFVVSQT